MATLRPIEERQPKTGVTLRTNHTVTYRQDRHIRTVVGRNDYRLDPNPDWHPAITMQVQEGKIKFFEGTPETAQSRAVAKELKVEDVPAYIIAAIKKKPIVVREPRPSVYEVKFLSPDDPEPVVQELQPDASGNVVVTPTAPDLDMNKRLGETRVEGIDA